MPTSFGPFAFDRQSRLLWRDGTEVALPPRVLGVLEVLIDRPGQVVARQDLLNGVWKDAFVTDTSLAEAVSFLRQALGDDPQAPRYIQTVHRRGYRFLPPLTETPPRGLTPVPPPASPDRGLTPDPPFAVASGDRPRSSAADWRLVPWSVAILCAGLAVAALWHNASEPAPDAPPVARFDVRAAPGTAFDRDPQPIAISPDGRSLAWSACETATGRCAIYVRPIDRLDPQPLAGTDGGHSPAFSPDGKWIAFFADGALKKIAAAGGAPTTLASAPDPAGAAWGRDGSIVFAGSAAGGLSLVNEQGGAVRMLSSPHIETGELRHRSPAWLPDSRGTGSAALVFTIARQPGADTPGELDVLTLSEPLLRTLRSGVTRAIPAGAGYLLLATATDLQAAAFDEQSLVLASSTDAVPVPGEGMPQFAAGADALAIVRSPAGAERAWTDGTGTAAFARLSSIAIAPDSRQAAGVLAEGNGADIWIGDLASGALTRMTFGGTNVSPAWSADGQRLYYATRGADGPFRVVSRAVANRNDPATPLVDAPPQAFPTSTAPDGSVAVTTYDAGRAGTSVAIVAPQAGRRVLTDGPFDEANAAFSPDGRWLALESTESGRIEIVVRATAGGRRMALSSGGGTHPRWSADGRAVYYDSGRRLMRAAFSPDANPPAHPETILDRAGARAIAVTPTGRVLIEHRPEADTAIVVLQWLRELRQRLPLPVTAPR